MAEFLGWNFRHWIRIIISDVKDHSIQLGATIGQGVEEKAKVGHLNRQIGIAVEPQQDYSAAFNAPIVRLSLF